MANWDTIDPYSF